MRAESWNAFSLPDTAVVTGSRKKRQLLSAYGVSYLSDPDAVALVGMDEDQYDLEYGNGVLIEGDGYSVRKARAKAQSIGEWQAGQATTVPRHLIVTDSVHTYEIGGRVISVDKHNGNPQRLQDLLSFYHALPPGTIVSTTTGIAVVSPDNQQPVLYKAYLRLGRWTPQDGLESFVAADENISGGYTTSAAIHRGDITLDPFVRYQIERLDSLGGNIIGGSLLERDSFTGELAGDAVNYEGIVRLNLGLT